MKKSALADLVTKLHADIEACNRFYRLDDRYAVALVVRPWTLMEGGDGIGLDLYKLVAHYEDEPVSWISDEIGGAPPAVMIRFAELKTMVGRWETGQVDDLPPSTMEDFITAQDERGDRRRRRHRR